MPPSPQYIILSGENVIAELADADLSGFGISSEENFRWLIPVFSIPSQFASGTYSNPTPVNHTISTTGTAVSGSGFLSTIIVRNGDTIVSSFYTRTVVAVISDTELILNSPFPTNLVSESVVINVFQNHALKLHLSPTGIISREIVGEHSVGNITLTSGISNANNQFGFPSLYTVSPVPLVSDLIESQLPAFVRHDHPNFVAFMDAYYEWLETHRNVQFDISRLSSYQDIDSSIDVFTEQFFKEFLTNIPRGILADKKEVLKHIREFYRAKGTEKSYEFFFRILFNISPDFYYPRVDMLKVSDGKWIQPKTLRISSTVGSPFDLVGRKIRGSINNASAFVEQVQQVQEGFLTVYELFLNRSGITGAFAPNELITASDANIEGIISPIVISITVTNPGSGYQVGQEILIGGPGIGATAVVQSVKNFPLTGPNGIQKIKITSFGAGYSTIPLVTCPGYTGVTTPASAIANLGALTTYPGSYLNEDGHLSASKYIQDGKYYQQFSYVVFVDESIERYRDALKRMIHPAGLELFGGFRAQHLLDASIKIPTSRGQVQSDIIKIHEHFKYVWVVFDTNNNPLNLFDTESVAQRWLIENGLSYTQTVETDYVVVDADESILAIFSDDVTAQDWLDDNTPSLYNAPFRVAERTDTHFKSRYLQRRDTREVAPYYFDPVDARAKISTEFILIHAFSEADNTAKLGPTYRSIERDKFYYKPFERRDITGEMIGNNAGYWGIHGVFISQFANYQIKDFKDITVKEMTEKPWTKINILPEAVLTNSDQTGISSEEEFGTNTVTHT